MSRLILFNKSPIEVLSQFTDEGTLRSTLKMYIDVPGVYPAGRAVPGQRGALLLLTDDGRMQARSRTRGSRPPRPNLVQVEGETDARRRWRRCGAGVRLKDGITLPADAERIDPQDGGGLLDFADDPRRTQPAGAADDGGGGVSDAAAGAGGSVGEWSLDGVEPGVWREVGIG